MSFVWQNLYISSFFVWLVAAGNGNVYIDFSDGQCVGCIVGSETKLQTLGQPGDNNTHCLRSCVQLKVKNAVYRPGRFCICMNYSDMDHEEGLNTKDKCCGRGDENSHFKVYKLTGVVMQFKFPEFIKRNEIVDFKPQILLNDDKGLKGNATGNLDNCTITINANNFPRSQAKLSTTCLTSFKFDSLGKNKICIGFRGSEERGCGNVRVLIPVILNVQKVSGGVDKHFPSETTFKVMLSGSVFNVRYDFGDEHHGAEMYKEPDIYRICEIKLQLRHNYTIPGEYKFTIWASNPLNVFKKELDVHVRIGLLIDLELVRWDKDTCLMYLKVLHVFVERNLTYKWHIFSCTNASLTPMETSVSSEKVMFSGSHLCSIRVFAYTEDSVLFGEKSQRIRQNLKLTIGVVNRYISKDTVAIFRAVDDMTKPSLQYSWKINGFNVTGNETLFYTFNTTGSYDVKVTHDSSTDIITIFVEDEISNVTIGTPLSSIVGLSITFTAHVAPLIMGVTFEWYFGDRKKFSPSNGTEKYTFQKPRDYNVTVIARNNVSSCETSIMVNVTPFCPTFDVETSFQNQTEVKVFRSLPIHLEVGVKSWMCVKPVTFKYFWKISKLNSSVWNDVDLGNQDVNKTTLGIYIPSNTLEYTKYRFQVKVVLTLVANRVIMHSEEYSTIYEITRTPLKAIIRGGFLRYVSNRTSTSITMDASMSLDPDYPEQDISKFYWTCKSKKFNSSCFKSGYTFQNFGSMIRDIPLSKFKSDSSSFVFNVTIGTTIGNGSGYTIQILNINGDDFHNTLLDCPSCNEGVLNPGKPVAILRKYAKCEKKKHTWKITQYGDTTSPNIEFEGTGCTKLNSIDHGLGIGGNNNSVLNPTYVPCEGNLSNVHFNEVKDIICRVLNRKLCEVSSGGAERDLRSEQRHWQNDAILEIKKWILPSEKFLRIESFCEDVVASRYFFVQKSPRQASCSVSPETGMELHANFRVTCAFYNDESRFFIYKVVFKREKDSNHDGKRHDIILQGTLPSLAFQLPSGSSNSVEYSLEFSIVNENGVPREYCAMKLNVSQFNPGGKVTVEEFLYNRSVTLKEMFHGHKYVYHAQNLHNITIIAEVLNRQPKVSNHSSKFHLRTQTRLLLIEILNRTEVFGEYATNQFADSLESCTRIPEELNPASTLSAVRALNRVFAGERRQKNLLERRTSTLDDYLLANCVDVADKLLQKINELGINQHDERVVQSLEYLFEAKLKSMRVDESKLTLKKDSFNATLLKFSAYDNGSFTVTCGNSSLTLSLKGRRLVTKPYFCDVYGYGLQMVTLNKDLFGQNGTSCRQISPMVKLTTYDCQGGKNELTNVTKVRISLPREMSQNPDWQPAVNRNITPSERHRFVLDGSSRDALEIELLPVSLMSPKLKLRLNLSCSDPTKHHDYYSDVTNNNPLKKGFSREMIKNCTGNVSIVISMHWIVPPDRVEQLRTVVDYTMVVKWMSCLSWNNNTKEWSGNNCMAEGVPGHFLTCSCSKIASGFIAVMKSSYVFLKTPIPRETTTVMQTVVVVLSVTFAIALIFIYVFEKQEQVRKRSVIVLTPSDPSHTHKYQVTVYTGHSFGAGTTAKVGIVLCGEQNSSYPVELSIDNYSLFRRNSRDNFIVSVREELGALTGIYLWHNNSGHSPSWFVEKIIIKDLISEDKWMFECCRWLAVDKQDKKLDCKVKPSEGKPKLTWQEFKFEFGKKMMDINVWLSLVGMPSYSLFRMTERLTCCLLMVFCYLFLNAYFYQNRSDTWSMDCISVFNPTFAQVEIGLLSALLVIPVYLLFAAMFRFTKPTETRKVTPSSLQNSDLGNNATSEPNILSLERCASVLRGLHHKSKRQTRRNQVGVAPQQVVLPNSGINSDGDSVISTVVTSDSTTDVLIVERPVIDHEITSQGSGFYMYYKNPEKFRFPGCFSILMWIGCITTSVFAAYFTLTYTGRFDQTTLVCYAQSVCWSLFLSFFVFQPFQALVVTLGGMLRRKYIYYDAYIEDPVEGSERGGKTLLISDRMDLMCGTTDQNSEEITRQKALYLKYLQPLPKKALRRARVLQKKKNQILSTARDVLLYFFLLVLLFLMTSYSDQQLIFQHDQRLKQGLTRQESTNSFRRWWSSGPQMVLETLKYDKFSGVITALGGRIMVIGNPKVAMTIKYCKNNSNEEKNNSLGTCSIHEEQRTIAFEKSQESNWMELSDYVYPQLTQHVKAVSLDFVIYSPALNLFSTLKWSSKVVLASILRSDVAVKTFSFCVDDSTRTSVYTIYQILFTLVPVLLILRQLHCCTQITTNMLLKVVELSIVILALLSSIIMWLWIKSQYLTLTLLRQMSFHADMITNAETIYNYQENLRLILGLLQFLVFLNLCHLIGFEELLASYGVTFSKTLNLVFVALFSLIVVLTAFAHTGLLLFGDYLESFSTFVKALSLNVIYLKEIDTANLFLENRDGNVLLFMYVVGFCVCMGLISCLLKAVFCQAHLYGMLSKAKNTVRVKTMFNRIAKRFLSLVKPYINIFGKKKEEDKAVVPMQYIVKEVNQKLDKVYFRLVNLFAIENMPPKTTALNESSSLECDDEEVEYICRMEDDVPLCHSPGLSSDSSDSPVRDSFPEPLKCSSVASVDIATSDNCNKNVDEIPLIRVQHESQEQQNSDAKPTIDATVSLRSRPFLRATPVFPKAISMQMNTTDRPIIRLKPFTQEMPSPCVHNSESATNLMPENNGENQNPIPVDLNHRFRSPDFPLSIDTLLGQSSTI